MIGILDTCYLVKEKEQISAHSPVSSRGCTKEWSGFGRDWSKVTLQEDGGSISWGPDQRLSLFNASIMSSGCQCAQVAFKGFMWLSGECKVNIINLGKLILTISENMELQTILFNILWLKLIKGISWFIATTLPPTSCLFKSELVWSQGRQDNASPGRQG